jgi:multiple sugar transport system permease protein
MLGTMTAYCLDRFSFPMKNTLKFLYMLSAIVPGVTLQLSIYKLFKEIHIQDWGTQFAAPILIYAATDIVQIWIYLQFMEKIPVSLDESVKMDGGSYFRIFRSIVFPLLGPATATVIIIKAVSVYNDMFVQFLYMSSGNRSISTMLSTFGGRAGSRIVQNAGLVMAMVPTIVLFILMQKYIFAGITVGSVKE